MWPKAYPMMDYMLLLIRWRRRMQKIDEIHSGQMRNEKNEKRHFFVTLVFIFLCRKFVHLIFHFLPLFMLCSLLIQFSCSILPIWFHSVIVDSWICVSWVWYWIYSTPFRKTKRIHFTILYTHSTQHWMHKFCDSPQITT